LKGPQFLRFVRPLVEVLRENGGSGPTAEIIDQVIERMGVSEKEVSIALSSGQSRVRNQVQWARMYLVNADLMDSSRRGIWTLTEKGFEAKLDDLSILEMFRKVHKTFEKKGGSQVDVTPTEEVEPEEDTTVEDEAHGDIILDLLKNLSPSGFEKLCKRLLTEIGIHDVQVTGQTGDQGIDGTGVIRINDVIGFNILFQCKRYREAVSPHHVRDFRGAMLGRADKGLIITTGRFTKEAKREAVRDGVPPIELIDGERLISLFEKYQLGLKPKTVYDVVPDFFENFK